jgi:hypothetical protein
VGGTVGHQGSNSAAGRHTLRQRKPISVAAASEAFLESGFALRHFLEVLVHRENAAGFLHAAVVAGRERIVNPVDTLPFRQRRIAALARDGISQLLCTDGADGIKPVMNRR